jgi:hypothetical protein
MKLSKEYLVTRLQTTSVDDLANEITSTMLGNYQGAGIVDRDATVEKFKKMLAPLAPIKAVDLARANGITVVEVA